MTTRTRLLAGIVTALSLLPLCGCNRPSNKPALQAAGNGLMMQDGRFVGPETDLPLQNLDLQKLIDEAPDGGLVAVPFGRYAMSKSLVVARRNNLHVAFVPGTQLRLDNTDLDVIRIVDCKNVKISGVRHVKPLTEYECHGRVVFIEKSEKVVIQNCELNGCGAVGVYADHSSVEVTHCYIHHNTWNALYLSDCSETSIVGNIIEYNANTLQVEQGSSGINLSDNLIQNNGGYWHNVRKPGLEATNQADLAPVKVMGDE